MNNPSQFFSVPALVHSFETCGTVDGPGIRFVIFLQGCKLRCKYCHNPDTWDCYEGKEYYADEIIKKALRYKPYMDSTNGGITISGGEPLLQPTFLGELLSKAKSKKIHTAIDTSGCIEDIDSIRDILPNIDLLLLDIKAMTDDMYRYITGSSFDLFLEFMEVIKNVGTKLHIRYVLVPNINDSRDDLVRLGMYLATLDNIVKFEILPFHKLGEYKWKELNYDYEFYEIRQGNIEDEKRAMEIIREFYEV